MVSTCVVSGVLNVLVEDTVLLEVPLALVSVTDVSETVSDADTETDSELDESDGVGEGETVGVGVGVSVGVVSVEHSAGKCRKRG